MGLGRGEAERIARRLRALADPTRLQLLALLLDADGGRVSVTALAAGLGVSQPTVSHHLRTLIDDGFVEREGEGRTAWFAITPTRRPELAELLRPRPTSAPTDLAAVTAPLVAHYAGAIDAAEVAARVRDCAELLAPLVHDPESVPRLAARFARSRLDATLAAARRDPRPRVLFVCVRNAGRSQLAAALLTAATNGGVDARSAGSRPADGIHPLVVTALDEVGIPLGDAFAKPLTDDVVLAADVVVTMGCGDACPVYPGITYLDWELPDPTVLPLSGVRAVRDDIARRVEQLAATLLPTA